MCISHSLPPFEHISNSIVIFTSICDMANYKMSGKKLSTYLKLYLSFKFCCTFNRIMTKIQNGWATPLFFLYSVHNGELEIYTMSYTVVMAFNVIQFPSPMIKFIHYTFFYSLWILLSFVSVINVWKVWAKVFIMCVAIEVWFTWTKYTFLLHYIYTCIISIFGHYRLYDGMERNGMHVANASNRKRMRMKKTHTPKIRAMLIFYTCFVSKKIMFTVQTGTYYNEVESTIGTYAEYVNIYIIYTFGWKLPWKIFMNEMVWIRVYLECNNAIFI